MHLQINVGSIVGIFTFLQTDTNKMLNDIKIKTAKAQDKDYKIADERSLYLFVKTNGSKLWRFAYRFEGKQKTLSLGQYPDVSLAQARDKRDTARKQLAQGFDPGFIKKTAKSNRQDELVNTFETIAREWHADHMKNKAPSHSEKVIRRFELYVFPYIGKMPISDIKPQDVIATLKLILKQNIIETAHRTLNAIGQVFRWAVQEGKLDRSPTADMKGFLPSRNIKHFAAFTKPDDVMNFLRSLDALTGGITVQNAVRLAPLLFCRPCELRMMRWDQLDLDNGVWDYFVGKVKREHLVPLSRQAIELILELQPTSGHLPYVFKGGRDPMRPMSESAVNAALKRLGYNTQTEITGHGFRAMARTMLHERLKIDPYHIEQQLSHKVPDQLGEAYNRTKFIDERVEMMQIWADYLDELKAGAKVIPFNKILAAN